MQTTAMRRVEPRMAGAASGVMNTTRQLGSVLGSAVVGALLQNQLASQLRDEAATRAGTLPEEVRQSFIDGFAHASSGRLEIGAGQNGVDLPLPPDLPPDIVNRITDMAPQVFIHGFVGAMRPTLVVPVATVAVGAVLRVFIQRRVRRARDAQPRAQQPGSEEVASAAQS